MAVRKFHVTNKGVAKRFVGLSLLSQAKKDVLKLLSRYRSTGRTRQQIVSFLSWGRQAGYGDRLFLRAIRELERNGYIESRYS